MNAQRHAVIAAWLITAGTAAAAQPAGTPDADFLEFLGSLDVEDEEWRDFLAERPVESPTPADASGKSPVRNTAPSPKPADASARQPAAKPGQVKKP